ncbi:hypothetical protein GCM10023191_000090 [Actinoallomurus oryzae]|uniref:SecDF P1 head subdomain domain-containing protein n=1 Tax=Actinoallomurus oryzae TaxID=502180 RepID=A0ABP8P3M2_9ACTN
MTFPPEPPRPEDPRSTPGTPPPATPGAPPPGTPPPAVPVGPPPAVPGGPAPYGWDTASGPQRRGRGLLVSLIVAAAALVLVGTVAAVLLLHGGGSADSASGPLKTPIRFLPVLSETPGSCRGAGTPSSDHHTCYRTALSGMTVTRVKSISVMSPDAEHGMTSWGIDLSLEPSDGRAFEQLSATAAAAGPQRPGNKIAMVVGGAVVSAPMVTETITGGRVQITGPYDEQAAKRLFHQLIGEG